MMPWEREIASSLHWFSTDWVLASVTSRARISAWLAWPSASFTGSIDSAIQVVRAWGPTCSKVRITGSPAASRASTPSTPTSSARMLEQKCR